MRTAATAESSTTVGTTPAEASTGARAASAYKPAMYAGKGAASRLESTGVVRNRSRHGYSSATVHDLFGHSETLQLGIETEWNSFTRGQVTSAQVVFHDARFHMRGSYPG
jgi:hypothetical protein